MINYDNGTIDELPEWINDLLWVNGILHGSSRLIND